MGNGASSRNKYRAEAPARSAQDVIVEEFTPAEIEAQDRILKSLQTEQLESYKEQLEMAKQVSLMTQIQDENDSPSRTQSQSSKQNKPPSPPSSPPPSPSASPAPPSSDQSAQQDAESYQLPEQWTSKLCDTMVLHTVQNIMKLAHYLLKTSYLYRCGCGTDTAVGLACSSLHVACWDGSVDAVVAEAGTEQAVRMWHSQEGELTPLHIASLCGHHHIVEYLVANLSGDAVDISTVNKICPIHIGASSSSDVTEVLIQAKADPSISTLDGDTPLHFACCYLQVPSIKMLLESGADAAAANAFGVTPLHIAVAHAALEEQSLKEAQVVLLLCSKGANPAAADCNGKTPADISRMADGGNELTEFLEKYSTAAQAQAEAQRIISDAPCFPDVPPPSPWTFLSSSSHAAPLFPSVPSLPSSHASLLALSSPPSLPQVPPKMPPRLFQDAQNASKSNFPLVPPPLPPRPAASSSITTTSSSQQPAAAAASSSSSSQLPPQHTPHQGDLGHQQHSTLSEEHVKLKI